MTLMPVFARHVPSTDSPHIAALPHKREIALVIALIDDISQPFENYDLTHAPLSVEANGLLSEGAVPA
ncbi:acetyltransferase, GNAT family domain protein [Burkholderia thailandensis]|uniref:Acetyltransferase, GNAT family domain protein n=1 Tax=Burkholderia thailandensis TaxID=57975 RepID=A0AAW9CZA7_BURTH|nr:hypothetical protein [Burkholderia thailandensis]MDW9254014.1 acetyltransferase, GNAT family domain protein [Burkholderia thailandensis]